MTLASQKPIAMLVLTYLWDFFNKRNKLESRANLSLVTGYYTPYRYKNDSRAPNSCTYESSIQHPLQTVLKLFFVFCNKKHQLEVHFFDLDKIGEAQLTLDM